MKKLTLLFVLVGLMGLTLLTIGAIANEPCQTTITSERPDWWVLANTYDTFDLIVYSERAVVFDLTGQQANALKNAHQVGLSKETGGRFRLCSFR
ncbi:MAG: hypothetical protein HY868_03790 [Chloroflexi bacterium]|nr:hypothetical protein [Chloroflexota bacterium]